MSKVRMFIATLETRNFTFEACNVSNQLAFETLRTALVKHAQQYEIADVDAWLREVQQDIEIRELRFGKAYRDGALL